MLKSLISYSLLFLLARVSSAFNAESKQNVALYWGQNSAGTQQSLGTYCQSTDADIYLLSFLYQFPTIGLNFANACYDTYSDGTLHCSQIAQDIKTCQSLGKKVFLSMGGASGAYGFTDDDSAKDFANVLWNTFGEGTDVEERPFDDAVVDGFDLDIENNNPTGYAALVTELRSLFTQGTKQYYISAAPQCPYPDASVGNAMQNADIDFAFIQFYNNYCNVDKSFNWDTWVEYAQSVSPNKDIKLYLGLPGSQTAAGNGYISDLSVLEETIQTISSSEYFGGVAMWDASQAVSNQVDGESYLAQIKSILKAVTSSSGTSASASAAKTSSVSSSTFTAATVSSSSAIGISSTSKDGTVTLEPTTNTPASSTSTTSFSNRVTSTLSEGIDSATTEKPTVSSTESSVISETQTSSPVSTKLVSSVVTSVGGKTTLAPTEPTSDITSEVQTAQTKTLSPSKANAESSTTTSTTTSSSTDTAAHSIAKQLNAQYAAGQYNGESACTSGDVACSADGQFAICNFGSWITMACAAGTTCYAYDSDSTVSTGCNFSSLKSDYV